MSYKYQLELIAEEIKSLQEIKLKLEQGFKCKELEYITNECVRNIGTNIGFLEKILSHQELKLSPEVVRDELISNWDLLITL
jgi:hypothetical protein